MNLVKKASIAASVALIAGFVGFYLSQFYDFFPGNHSKAELYTTQNEETVTSEITSPTQAVQLVSHIASWQDSSTRQLVYSSLPKKQRLTELEDDDEPSNTVALVDKVVVIPKIQVKNWLYTN